ncbi:hypothetical protein O6H91_06G077400 [Diphasiastrum complanatum]|uniref:Uncharacterized protein n=5 Tax=Diphasiastrum complanatum TaxID=34168 RepID=A0ACC2DFQ0_DIPCM|nr:hypothetical protein O6H91_06G077400 [Diphasiastrum complanatum]KAJ7552933.1 hypothetical protein O6H91_06G077400 [Diphasiastrum complanatum]KAJ7552934.1 hypothetical protein O6H91_06G077400 [Diphasiastrum complanatum]KAJ7552935.1 hypothetical protein O6H91_06G077400 [Diphasiastrum complanatum]KAJ7552936.1 hypothetical protein O6H91_06G077400 [Diphasiastrum complanatum]
MGDEPDSSKNAREACQVSMAASKQLTGGSLPPRKRLLVGLKQNGWSISTTLPPCPSRGSDKTSDAAMATAKMATKEDDRSVDAGAGSEVQKQVEEGCARCGGCENSAWRRLRKGGVYQRFCNSCVLLYSTSMYCPHCLGLYQDVKTLGDPSVWLICCQCQRSVHVECELKNNKNKSPDPLPYLCPNCSAQKSPCNGIFGGREKIFTESQGPPTDSTNPTDGASGEVPSENPHFGGRLSKKRRVSRESRTNFSCGALSVHREGSWLGQVSSSSTSEDSIACKSLVLSAPVSAQEAAAAAKAAACLAVKAAAAAKATAVAKALVAVKAAAAAKAALEAAALAARAEVRARAELSRRSILLEIQGQTSAKNIQITVGTEREVGENVDKLENPVDDEELARHLHRVMNSSPRITRSAAPFSKKIEAKTEVEAEVKVSAHSGSCSSDEPLPFPKPQLTRPRSVIHKESKRLESKSSTFDLAKSQFENIKNDLQQSTSQTAAVNDGSSGSHQHRSSPLACIEHSDGNAIVSHKQNTVDLLKTSTSDKRGCLDPANLKMERLCSTILPVVRDDSMKTGHSCKTLVEAGPYEAENLPVGGLKFKQGGIFEKHSDTHVKTEDGKVAFRVKDTKVNAFVCAENRSGLQCQVSEEQTPSSRDERGKGQGTSQQEVAKLTDKQKTHHHHWKSVSKLLSSVDKQVVIFDTKTFSSSQRAEDHEGKFDTSIRNGAKNGENCSIKTKPRLVSGKLGIQRSGFKETVSRLEAQQLLPRHKVSRAEEEALSTFGSSSKVVKNSTDDLKSRHIDVSKANRPARGPNVMSFTSSPSAATVSALTSGSIARHP